MIDLRLPDSKNDNFAWVRGVYAWEGDLLRVNLVEGGDTPKELMPKKAEKTAVMMLLVKIESKPLPSLQIRPADLRGSEWRLSTTNRADNIPDTVLSFNEKESEDRQTKDFVTERKDDGAGRLQVTSRQFYLVASAVEGDGDAVDHRALR